MIEEREEREEGGNRREKELGEGQREREYYESGQCRCNRVKIGILINWPGVHLFGTGWAGAS